MGDPQKQAELEKQFNDASAKAGEMSPEELIQAQTSQWNQSFGMAPTADGQELEKFAQILASKEHDDTLTQKESDEDYYQARGFHRRMAEMYAAELTARGYELHMNSVGAVSWTLKPTADTGHYDDGHAFGWQKPPEPKARDDTVDTGYYDDGHAFGWKSPKSGVPMPLVGIGAAGLLVVAGLLFVNRPATVASDATQAAATPSLNASTSAPVGTRPAAVIDVCALVTAAESSTILEKPTTTQTTTPGLQCFYKPQTPATWSFKEGTATANLRVDSLFVTVATGGDAQSRYAAKQAIYGKDPTVDEVVNGVGDKALFTAGTELSVLAGSRFINVRFQGDYDWGSGNTRYESVHQKIISLLSAFAKIALPRMP